MAARVEQALVRIAGKDNPGTSVLRPLLADIEADDDRHLVVDLPEYLLDGELQHRLIADLRWRAERGERAGRSLFLITRSKGILDLEAVGRSEAVFFFSPSYSPPARITPLPGMPGYEAVATCLATPADRARIEQAMPWRLLATSPV